MKIALAHFRVGETDGVSLEMEKWRTVLEELGHTVYFLSGSREYGEIYLPELFYLDEENLRHVRNAYEEIKDYEEEKQFREDLDKAVGRITTRLEEVIKEYELNVLVPNNIWSLGWNLAAGAGFYKAVKQTNSLGDKYFSYQALKKLLHEMLEDLRKRP